MHYATGNNPYTFGPNSQVFTVTIGSNTVSGLMSVQALYIGGPYGFFAGKYQISSSTWGFVQTGYPVGALIDIDFVTYNGKLSSGELVPQSVPEPGTMGLLGSGLLAAAGMLRRKL
ncbi:MAG TPA: PEP-CTERM sorting domain-containing protein [Terriglobales bacterium]